MRSLHDDRRNARFVAEPLEHRLAVRAWHYKVEEDEGVISLLGTGKNVEGLVTGSSCLGLQPKSFDAFFK